MQHPYRINFEYYRVPSFVEAPKKGRPKTEHMKRYGRGEGFLLADPHNVLRKPSSKGGATVCNITANGKQWTACAFCSHSDNFSYKLGRDISLGRAMKLYNEEQTKSKRLTGRVRSVTERPMLVIEENDEQTQSR